MKFGLVSCALLLVYTIGSILQYRNADIVANGAKQNLDGQQRDSPPHPRANDRNPHCGVRGNDSVIGSPNYEITIPKQGGPQRCGHGVPCRRCPNGGAVGIHTDVLQDSEAAFRPSGHQHGGIILFLCCRRGAQCHAMHHFASNLRGESTHR